MPRDVKILIVIALLLALYGLIFLRMRRDIIIKIARSKVTPTQAETPKKITMKGTLTCLPHKGNGEMQTMECAYGLKGADGHHYGLKSRKIDSNTMINYQINDKLVVSGTTEKPTANQNYDIVAVLVYDSITLQK